MAHVVSHTELPSQKEHQGRLMRFLHEGAVIPDGYLFSRTDIRNLIIPLMVEQLLSVLVGLADSIMVAHAGEAAMSGVSLVDSVFLLIINIFAALATGGAVVAGHFLGMQKDKDGCRTVNQLLLFIAFTGCLVAGGIYLGRNVLMSAVFGQIEPDVRANAMIYLIITTGSIPFIALYNAGAAVFRAMGNSSLPMKIALAMNGINIVGNAILIFGFHMNAAGVAIPTLVSRAFAGIVILFYLNDQENRLHILHPFSFRPDRVLLKKILYVGIPNGIENSLFQLGKILLISVVSVLGTAAISANAMSNTITSFQSVTGNAMQYAMLAVASQCVGANDYEQVKYYTRLLIKKSYLYMWMSIGAVGILLPLFMKFYNVSPEAVQFATEIVVFHGVVAAVLWPLSFVFPNMLRAANDVKFCMIVSSVSMWTLRIFGSIFAVRVLHMGVFGIWFLMPFDWVFRIFFFIRRYRSGKWMVTAARN